MSSKNSGFYLLVFQLSVRRCSSASHSPMTVTYLVFLLCFSMFTKPQPSPGDGCWPPCGPWSPAFVGGRRQISWKQSLSAAATEVTTEAATTEAATTEAAATAAASLSVAHLPALRGRPRWRGWPPSATMRHSLPPPNRLHPGQPWSRTGPHRRVRRLRSQWESCWLLPGGRR
jgi:hypothetical protein